MKQGFPFTIGGASLMLLFSHITIAEGLSGVASSAMTDQAIDQAVDTGAGMAKEQLKGAGSSATDGISGAASDAMMGSAKDQAIDQAVDAGADVTKDTAKSMLK